jgi:hypothetical protein
VEVARVICGRRRRSGPMMLITRTKEAQGNGD